MNPIYDNEAQMRANHPYLANHLATIAQLNDGVYTAQTAGVIYKWRDKP